MARQLYAHAVDAVSVDHRVRQLEVKIRALSEAVRLLAGSLASVNEANARRVEEVLRGVDAGMSGRHV